MIVNIGYINAECSVIRYKKDKMEVLNVINEKVGGREIDKLLIEYFYEKMKEYEPKVNDINKDIRLYWKIENAVINVKEKLSATGADNV